MSAFPPTLAAEAMRKACAEARNWLGATAPNPPVGAVALDRNGAVIATAAHRKAGESHAEATLIDLCQSNGTLGAIATLGITLEPCNHHGHTPPCADKIIQSGIRRVIIGARDPNPHVRGGGAQRLREAGIEVLELVEEEKEEGGGGGRRRRGGREEEAVHDECQQLIHAFAYAVTTGKPWVTVKQAFTRDGSMIPPPGLKTFTSRESLRLAHRLRKKAGAILTGSGTILADQPLFTTRHAQDFPAAQRTLAIMDRRKRVPTSYLQSAQQRGFTPLLYADLDEAFSDLAQRGIQDILVEAGPALSQAILQSPHWTLQVAIRQNAANAAGSNPADKIETHFNPAAPIPFATDRFRWNYFLPA